LVLPARFFRFAFLLGIRQWGQLLLKHQTVLWKELTVLGKALLATLKDVLHGFAHGAPRLGTAGWCFRWRL